MRLTLASHSPHARLALASRSPREIATAAHISSYSLHLNTAHQLTTSARLLSSSARSPRLWSPRLFEPPAPPLLATSARLLCSLSLLAFSAHHLRSPPRLAGCDHALILGSPRQQHEPRQQHKQTQLRPQLRTLAAARLARCLACCSSLRSLPRQQLASLAPHLLGSLRSPQPFASPAACFARCHTSCSHRSPRFACCSLRSPSHLLVLLARLARFAHSSINIWNWTRFKSPTQ
eukprot:5421681-Prymnesium_polylepis.1